MRASLEPRLLILCPLAREWSFLVSTFEASLHVERLHDLKIEGAYIPDWRALVAPGGHGKTQFAVQAQYLIDRFSSVELIICAGAAGSLAPEYPWAMSWSGRRQLSMITANYLRRARCRAWPWSVD